MSDLIEGTIWVWDTPIAQPNGQGSWRKRDWTSNVNIGPFTGRIACVLLTEHTEALASKDKRIAELETALSDMLVEVNPMKPTPSLVAVVLSAHQAIAQED